MTRGEFQREQLAADAKLRAGEVPTPRLDYQRFVLDCGAVLLVDRRDDAPVAALKVHLRGGHSLDPAGLEGTAHLTGRLCDQGTAQHTEEELAALLEPSGGGLRGDSNGISASVESSSWKLLVEVAAEVLRGPTYPEEKVARHRGRLLDKLLVEQDDHRVQTGLLFRRLVYGQHWLGRPSYGSHASVARIQRDELVAFHADNWCPERIVIGFSGAVAAQTVRRAFERALAGWRKCRPLPPPDESFPPIEPRTGVFAAERQQVHVYLGHLGVRRNHPLYPALVVMDHVLGTGPGFSNRISRRLRDEEGLAYSVHAEIHSSAGVFPGTFTAYIGTSPEHLGRAVKGFLEEMRRIRDEPVDGEELALAKSYLLGSHALGFERAARRASHLVGAERLGLPANHLEELPKLYAAVTSEDVQRAARECLFPSAPCLAVGGPVEETAPAELLSDVLRPRGRGRR